MTIAGILFDKDGTLLDFNATWVPIYRAAAHIVAKGDGQLAGELLHLGGQNDRLGTVAAGSLLAVGGTDEIAALWAGHYPGHGFADLAATLDEVFQNEGKRSAAAVPGLRQTLIALKARGLVLGVATSDSAAGARATLQPFDVLDEFDFVAGYDSGFGGKPDPGMVLAFCAAAGLAPGQVMVVGDNSHDLEMGRRAGAGLCVGVLTGTSARQDLDALADHVLSSIADVIGLLYR